jgi:hypothetical protein
MLRCCWTLRNLPIQDLLLVAAPAVGPQRSAVRAPSQQGRPISEPVLLLDVERVGRHVPDVHPPLVPSVEHVPDAHVKHLCFASACTVRVRSLRQGLCGRNAVRAVCRPCRRGCHHCSTARRRRSTGSGWIRRLVPGDPGDSRHPTRLVHVGPRPGLDLDQIPDAEGQSGRMRRRRFSSSSRGACLGRCRRRTRRHDFRLIAFSLSF